jgi:stage III sporulation protein AG
VLVVAEGAGDLKVNMALQRAVQALLDVDAEQIEILTMKEDDV